MVLPGHHELEEIFERNAQIARMRESFPQCDAARAEDAMVALYVQSGFRPPSRAEWITSPTALPEEAWKSLAYLKRCHSCDSVDVPTRFHTQMARTMFRMGLDTRGSLLRRVASALDSALSEMAGSGASPRRRNALEWGVGPPGGFSSLATKFLPGWCSRPTAFLRQLVLREIGAPLSPVEHATLLTEMEVFLCIPTMETAYFCHPPSNVRLDRDGMVHREDGPAISWPDDTGIAFWRDQHIPTEWVTGRPPSPMEALRWRNMDQRSAACEIVGWHNILDGLPHRILDRDPDPMIGSLLEVRMPESEPEKFLRVKCGTGRDFALPVPPEVMTAIQGQSVLHGLPEDVIRSIERRT